jgi:hypothetical protein
MSARTNITATLRGGCRTGSALRHRTPKPAPVTIYIAPGYRAPPTAETPAPTRTESAALHRAEQAAALQRLADRRRAQAIEYVTAQREASAVYGTVPSRKQIEAEADRLLNEAAIRGALGDDFADGVYPRKRR